MSVIVGKRLRESLGKRLYVTPITDKSQIGVSSIDVRLGSIFIVAERRKQFYFDPHDSTQLPQAVQRKVYVSLGDYFVLHPRAFALAATFEYVKLTNSVFAILEGRSSPGRTGLLIATAGAVHPGFAGCPTLELINTGEVPVILSPGDKIAQLVFFEVSREDTEGSLEVSPSRYQVSVEPGFTKWHLDVSEDKFLKHYYPAGKRYT